MSDKWIDDDGNYWVTDETGIYSPARADWLKPEAIAAIPRQCWCGRRDQARAECSRGDCQHVTPPQENGHE